MSRLKTTQDAWDEIFDDLILETEPPIRYIKDAIIITKSGAKFKVSPDDYADIVARDKMLGPDQSDIQSCSLSIDFTRIKRDVNKWASRFISDIEGTDNSTSKPTVQKTKKTKKEVPPSQST